MDRKHLTETAIQAYIEGGGDSVSKEHLQGCKQCFHTYVTLKEALFMMARGERATPAEVASVLGMVADQNRSHARIILRFFSDRIMISSAGQEDLDFQGVEAAFSYRGSNVQGPISVTRRIGEREITVVLSPDAGGEGFTVSVLLKTEESIEVILYSEGREMETIPDLSRQKMFDAVIPREGIM